VGVSCDREHLVASQVKTDGSGRYRVEIEGFNSLLDIGFKLIPAIGLGEYALAERFGGEPAVCFLRDFKHDLINAVCPLPAFLP